MLIVESMKLSPMTNDILKKTKRRTPMNNLSTLSAALSRILSEKYGADITVELEERRLP